MPYLDQHFLKNHSILEHIAKSITSTNNDTLVEIGPGKGALSEYLIKKDFKELILFEKDRTMNPYLQEIKNSQNVKLYFDSILEHIESYKYAKFFGNIPYAITEPLYKKFLESGIEEAILLHGKDFYITYTQKPVSKWFYYINAFYNVELLDEIKGEEFEPPTKVTSVVVHIVKKSSPSKKDLFWQEFFKRESRTLKNTLIFSIIDTFSVSKKEAKKMIDSFLDPILTKKTSQLSNKEFQLVTHFVEENIFE